MRLPGTLRAYFGTRDMGYSVLRRSHSVPTSVWMVCPSTIGSQPEVAPTRSCHAAKHPASLGRRSSGTSRTGSSLASTPPHAACRFLKDHFSKHAAEVHSWRASFARWALVAARPSDVHIFSAAQMHGNQRPRCSEPFFVHLGTDAQRTRALQNLFYPRKHPSPRRDRF